MLRDWRGLAATAGLLTAIHLLDLRRPVEGPPSSATRPVPSDDTAAMREEVRRLQQEVAGLRQATTTAIRTIQELPTTTDDDVETRAPLEPPAANDRSGEDYWDRLNDALLAETGAPLTAAHTLKERVSSVLPARSSIRSVDCRGQLCRMELGHRDRAEVEAMRSAWRENLRRDPLWEGPMVSRIVSQPDAPEIIVEMYLAHGELPE
jgi:hypothetical protein